MRAANILIILIGLAAIDLATFSENSINIYITGPTTVVQCSKAACIPECGAHGECTGTNTCTCNSGWEGSKCQNPVCNPGCGTNGVCTGPDSCICNSGWEGTPCQKSRNPGSAPVYNFPPAIKIPIDFLSAIEGQRFSTIIYDDYCNDFEDGDSDNLSFKLFTSDGSELPPDSWLQFDPLWRTIDGTPLETDIGTEIYHMECMDSEGLKAYGSFIVNIRESDA